LIHHETLDGVYVSWHYLAIHLLIQIHALVALQIWQQVLLVLQPHVTQKWLLVEILVHYEVVLAVL
jgi:hypothetical protein